MLGIDLSIVVHEINTYAMIKRVRQKICQLHRKKSATIKDEVKKLLKEGFIYPVPLTKWVSNSITFPRSRVSSGFTSILGN